MGQRCKGRRICAPCIVDSKPMHPACRWEYAPQAHTVVPRPSEREMRSDHSSTQTGRPRPGVAPQKLGPSRRDAQPAGETVSHKARGSLDLTGHFSQTRRKRSPSPVRWGPFPMTSPECTRAGRQEAMVTCRRPPGEMWPKQDTECAAESSSFGPAA